ncbi:hypothetical protein [Brevundimonas aurantiaca]|uniref:hypothetical protein n=1 Tax=Brevundimonas aurantiaca TaxID=74316 RepID=UPI001CD4886C|nr:hypothetical protein [Brevundimonas aurantiaca]
MKLSRIDRVLSRSGKAQGNEAPAAAPASRAEEQDVAGLIGERFETIQDSLDQLAEMAQRFGTFETLLGQLRDPLEAEFRSRRDNHVELVNLRNAHDEAARQLGLANAEVRRLSEALAEAEAKVDDLEARGAESAANLQEARSRSAGCAPTWPSPPPGSKGSRRSIAPPSSASANWSRTRSRCAYS